MSNIDIEKANIGQVVGPASAVCRECLCAPPLPLPKTNWTHFSLPPTPLALAEDSIAAICKANVPRNAATHASFEISIAIGGYASGCLHCTRTASEFTLHVSLKLNRTSAHIRPFMYILHGVYIYICVRVGGCGWFAHLRPSALRRRQWGSTTHLCPRSLSLSLAQVSKQFGTCPSDALIAPQCVVEAEPYAYLNKDAMTMLALLLSRWCC